MTEYYMYDATNIRLRELAVSYALPQKLVRPHAGAERRHHVAGRAQPLLHLQRRAVDPDLILSTGNDNQGIEVYGMPTVRNIGFNIKLEF